MKLLKSNRMRLVVVGVVVVIVFGSGDSVKADFVVSEPVFIDEVINSPGTSNTQGHSLLHDGLKLYYVANRGPSGSGMWISERKSMDSPWTEPVYLSPYLNPDVSWAQEPAISPDDLELYFYQKIDNVWRSMRSIRSSTDDDWERATEFNELGDDAWGLDFSPDGLTVYFDSMRSGGYGGIDIWMATRETVNSPWNEPVNLGENVNGPDDQTNASISNEGLALFFNSNGSVWMCTRASIGEAWGPAIDLDFDDTHPVLYGQRCTYGRPEISPDGSILYLDSHRSNSLGNTESFWQASINPIVDLNSDGIVDSADVCIMIDHWGTDNRLCDIGPMPWGDGVVDVEDLKVLMSYWGQEAYDPALIAHWMLDETEGAVARDSAGLHDATMLGDPLWQPEGGQVGGALQLDGVDDYVVTPFILNPADGPFSILVWIQGGASGQVIISQPGGADWLKVNAEGKLMTELSSAGRDSSPLQSQTVITDGQWYRMGLAWDGSRRSLYVDGVVAAEDTQSSMGASSGGLYIGVGKDLTPGTFFSGLIDDVRIYDRPVSP